MAKPTLNDLLRARYQLDSAELSEKPALLEKFNQLLDGSCEATNYSRETLLRAIGPRYETFKRQANRKDVANSSAILRSKP